MEKLVHFEFKLKMAVSHKRFDLKQLWYHFQALDNLQVRESVREPSFSPTAATAEVDNENSR